jgi:general secretion pathway protein G
MVQIQSTPARVKADITLIKEALDAYAMQHEGRYPDGLHALVLRDEHDQRYLNLERVPRDPWQREYIYVRGQTVDVLTYGRDGVPGGDGDDADVSYMSMVSEHE